MGKYFVQFLSFFVIVTSSQFYSQTYSTSPYIIMPGDNYDIAVAPNIYGSVVNNSYICWVNKNDSVYSLYLRQTALSSDENILVYSDTSQISNPKIAFTDNFKSNNVRLVWQSLKNNHWQILSRIYGSDSLTSVVSITDSLEDNITPALYESNLAWIRNGDLVYRCLDSADTGFIILDSTNCSNPSMNNFSFYNAEIAYEKGLPGNKQIMLTQYDGNYNQIPELTIVKITDSGNYANPRLNFECTIPSYEKYENGVWKAVYDWGYKLTTDNLSCNCNNPVGYSNNNITKRSSIPTNYFLVYDSDSLKNNKEIFMKIDAYPWKTLNLSNAEGDDYLPYISFYFIHDTSHIVIFWTHEENGKKDIWMSVSSDVFQHANGVADNSINNIDNFNLEQNYPNPFNPSTEISWNIAKGSPVTLKIYDILGNEIATLVNEYQLPGEHSASFDTRQISGSKLSSGVYFYQLRAGAYTLTKKMMYLK